jgi:EmrB/QacA subfamily drug resistance transporter
MATPESSASSRPPDVAATALERPVKEGAVLATVALATMLAPLNSTMIAVALPIVIGEFAIDVGTGAWLVTAYLIVMAALQPVAGKLGDRLGRRPLILGGLLWFGLASVGASVAGDFALLLVFRLQQAIAGAIALPNAAALVREIVPAERRASRSGQIGAAIALAAAAGPPIGGLLVGLAGWRSIFFVNALIVLPALVLGWRAIPRPVISPSSRQFDLAGAITLSVLLAGFAGLFSLARRPEAPFALVPGCFVIAIIGVLFLRREFLHPDPILQPRFFRRRAFAAANAAVLLSNLAMYTTLLAIPLMLSRQVGWSAIEAGFVLAALSAAMVVLAPVGGRMADRFGRRWPTVAGLSLLAVGLIPLALSGWTIDLPVLVASLGLAGVGLGLSAAGMQTAAVEAVEAQHAGVASGVYSTSRYVGSIVGSSILAGLVGLGDDRGFSILFVIVVAAAALSAVASLGLHDRPSS